MDIWKMLGIEPTTDKRAIRRAYAARTKEIHPEEKPEEFKQLHKAYQMALGYADYVRQVEQSGGSVTSFYRTDTVVTKAADADETAEQGAREEAADTAEEAEAARNGEADAAGGSSVETEAAYVGETAGEAELLTFFGEQQKRQQQRVEDFVKYWNEMKSPYDDPQMLDWWKAYLTSEAFQDIRYHPQVLSLLADKIDDKFFYGINDIKILFWDAYGFQGDGKTAYLDYGEDELRLYRSLYPAYEKRRRAAENERKGIKRHKITRVMLGAAAAAVLVAVLLSFVSTYRQKQQEKGFLIDYMAQQYPETTFSEPEFLGKDDFDGGNVYTMRSSVHPDLSVTAVVYYKYVEGTKTRKVSEDYDRLLFEYYAAQYGLASDWADGYNVILYTDIGEIDEVCAKAEKMFREQEELRVVSETAFYTKQVLFPGVLFVGGLPNVSFADAQIYDLHKMNAAEAAKEIRKAYMIYMFQYEAWNINTAQYREWGAAYEKICEDWENDDGEWLTVYDPDTGESLCRLFVSTYELLDMYYSKGGTPAPMYTRMMTVGNAYLFLREKDADINVDENGRGFDVKYYGTNTWFGYEPEVEFNDLQRLY